MRRKFVISTVGTSILTNAIDRNSSDEKDWRMLLGKEANFKKDEVSEKLKEVVQKLRARAEENLQKGESAKLSAELNGLWNLYRKNWQNARQDYHYLIPTDTWQGNQAAAILKNFLETQNINSGIKVPRELSTRNTEHFTLGVDDLLEWMENTIPGYRDKGYEVVFNLVGGFKSLQGYMNTIAMFHADETIYIFEGQEGELIKIPRLPINIDEAIFEKHKQEFLLLAIEDRRLSELPQGPDGIPAALLTVMDESASLSTWGKLMWNKAKKNVLQHECVEFPNLEYSEKFKKDFKDISDKNERVHLVEKLAQVSSLLARHNNDLACLKKNGGFCYEDYQNQKEKIGHFRISQDRRVSCLKTEQGRLLLRHYGSHDYVNNNP